MTNRTTDPRHCTAYSWCDMGKYDDPESHANHHAGPIADLQKPTQQPDDSIRDGWWTWVSQDVTGPRAGVTMVHFEGHPEPGGPSREFEIPAADLDVILAQNDTPDGALTLAGVVRSAMGRRAADRAPDPDFVCPRFEWCTYGRTHRDEHDNDLVHAGDNIELHGYGVDADGIHDRGFLAYLAHDDGEDEPWLVVWGFSETGKFLSETVSGVGVLMLLSGVKNHDELDRLRRGVTGLQVVEKDQP